MNTAALIFNSILDVQNATFSFLSLCCKRKLGIKIEKNTGINIILGSKY